MDSSKRLSTKYCRPGRWQSRWLTLLVQSLVQSQVKNSSSSLFQGHLPRSLDTTGRMPLLQTKPPPAGWVAFLRVTLDSSFSG